METQHPHVIADPRARCYPEDSRLWALLLAWAYGQEQLQPEAAAHSLFGALHGLRCGGARLVIVDGCARLRPGDWDGDEYTDLRDRYLRPHTEMLNSLLADLGKWAVEQSATQQGGERVRQEALL